MWNEFLADLESFDLRAIFSAFMILFVAIDTIGAIPIVLSLKTQGKTISPNRISLYSGVMLIAFLFVGEPMLGFFGVDISSFGVAGAVVLFVLAVEMIFGIQVFKDDGPSNSSTIVPLVFPLFAGAASFTTMLTLRADGFAVINILCALLINVLAIFLMLKYVGPVEKFLGEGGVYILRKFFGVLLLAISVKFFTGNLLKIIDMSSSADESATRTEQLQTTPSEVPVQADTTVLSAFLRK
ncbi:multiple antibiotic resistance protein marC [Porphyromonas crevioricanis JCM 15906]|uniref:UPF0056 membrane protein n=1 Tax=Porphyromonas crevioricanis JCM 15906 TaxID=1305617 RepID=S4N900_9PORP|nr:MarC family protein [Porphyromonas crevioricanis]GAD04336.1 multiple antibiotic resistance protein marC [Porphyromonas crevioricanis JCM 15906]SJZ82048.1 multiple antibiotic resistance protein [Porphyromonas crevioricanis]